VGGDGIGVVVGVAGGVASDRVVGRSWSGKGRLNSVPMEDRRSSETLDFAQPGSGEVPSDGSATRDAATGAGVENNGVASVCATGNGVASGGMSALGGPVLAARRRPGAWADLGWLLAAQVAVLLPLLAVAAGLGGSHLSQVGTAAACVWPWVLLSYAPLLVPTTLPSVLVQIYLAIMIRLFGTLATVVVVRQIAAPLAPDSWFAYISAFYLTGLAAESWLMIVGLHRDSVPVASR